MSQVSACWPTPVRRELYRFVCSQAQPVTRDQAAEAVGVARHKAKFHLDRLEAEGLLEADYVRMTGRTGPGAGRPAKRYRRGSSEFAVTIPARDYELAGHIMADAISESEPTGTPISDALSNAAAARGAGPSPPFQMITHRGRCGSRPCRPYPH
jgi:predicted ArsR family transcriptional regulator